MPDQRHVDAYRPRCKTDAQRREFDRLMSLGKTPWPSRYRGATVVGEFRRYLETCDASKIGGALYEFSIMGCGGFDDIAHYNLHGFRAQYPHPMLYLYDVMYPAVRKWPPSYRQSPDGYHSFHVYTDGMHDGQAAHQLVRLAVEHQERLLDDFRGKAQAKAMDELLRLAGELGLGILRG